MVVIMFWCDLFLTIEYYQTLSLTHLFCIKSYLQSVAHIYFLHGDQTAVSEYDRLVSALTIFNRIFNFNLLINIKLFLFFEVGPRFAV